MFGEYNDCSGYWLAAPSAKGAYYMLSIDCTGNDYSNDMSNNLYGLRPVVCLPNTTLLNWNETSQEWDIIV